MEWQPENVIATDKYIAAFPENYHKTDVFYVKDPVDRNQSILRRPHVSTPFIVTGHSDYSIQDIHTRMYPNTKWFCVNSETPRAQGIPLGITNHSDESYLHCVYGDIQTMYIIAQEPRERQNLVYMNFSIDTYPEEREKVWKLFESKPWVTKGEHIPTFGGRSQFLRNIRNHDFVLCPRGSGIDTHRLWETLYMGSIPIVKWNIVHSNWTDLPILFIDSWEDVTEEKLEQEYERIRSSSWNLKKLDVHYWIEYIQKSIQ